MYPASVYQGSYTTPSFNAIRCTLPNCTCECFAPGKVHIRTCDQCKHGWVAHALDKLSTRHLYPSFQVEVVQFNIVFDIGSLILYGTQAIPTRLKILLDRLFSVLKHDEVIQVLHGLGWMYEDYARGYVLQAPDGKVLEQWMMTAKEEEKLILQQFLRFGETKSITEVMIQQDNNEGKTPQPQPTQNNESDIRAFIERMNTMRQLSIHAHQVSTSSPQQTVFTGFTPTQPEITIPETKPTTSSSSHSAACSPTPKFSPKIEPVTSPAPKSEPPPRSEQLQVQQCSPISAPSPVVSAAPSPQSADETPKRYMLCSTDRPNSHSSYLSMKLKHLRKSAQPKKKFLIPFTINTSGPKQVTCNLCNKAFYNKGTWKIHYSSVHLKQKYKCTIEGCNMLFSSLRSRNRHSSNPNPKIHSAIPKQRVQISDTAARADSFLSANPSGSVLNTLNDRFLSPPVINVHDGLSSQTLVPSTLQSQNVLLDLRCAPMEEELHMDDSLPKEIDGVTVVTPVDSDSSSSTTFNYHSEGEEKSDISISLKKNPRKCLKPVKLSHKIDSDDDNGNEDDRFCSEESEQRFNQGVRKRKSNTPTRCLASNSMFKEEASSESEPESDTETDTHTQNKSDGDDDDDEDDCDDDEDNTNSGEGESGNEMAKNDVQDGRSNNRNMEEKKDVKDVNETNSPKVSDTFSDDVMHQPDSRMTFAKLMAMQMMEQGYYPPYFAKGGGSLVNENVDPKHPDGTNDFNRVLSTLPVPKTSIDIESNSSSPTLPNSPGLMMPCHSCIGSSDIYLMRDGIPYCVDCAKPFQSTHGVKTHYQNVHLKIMHSCTVAGCNASFPSKRSRDRHSSNLNLHRKLLAKDAGQGSYFHEPVFPHQFQEQLMHQFMRVQDINSNGIQGNSIQGNKSMENGHGTLLHNCSDNNISHNFHHHENNFHIKSENTMLENCSENICNSQNQYKILSENGTSVNAGHFEDKQPSYGSHHPNHGEKVKNAEGNSHENMPTEDASSENDLSFEVYPSQLRTALENGQSSSNSSPEPVNSSVGESPGYIKCDICHNVYSTKTALQEHYKNRHLQLMHPCQVPGCFMMFTSLSSRNQHSQNESLHRNLNSE
ncbi:zinc finger protein basonuclin-2-like [Glandiceps talaboti]